MSVERTTGEASMAASNEHLRVAYQHDIGWAIKQAWNGQHMRRRGWNGKGMHIGLQMPDANSKMTEPYLFMRLACGAIIPWVASQSDLLGIDWEFAEV